MRNRTSTIVLILGVAEALFLGEALLQGISYEFDQAYVARKAREITAGAVTDQDKVMRLVGYLREHVRPDPLPIFNLNRPFLRYDARHTLMGGNAFCGESVRTLICLLASLGIQARRVNMYGTLPHVTCEVHLDGKWIIYDPQENQFVWPQKYGGVTVQEVLARHLNGWSDYSTLNLRRAGLNVLLGSPTRVKTRLSWTLTWILENPHLMKMIGFGAMFLTVLLGWGCVVFVRSLSSIAPEPARVSARANVKD